ncbi:MAG TPA: DEAD/DEAH box helicase family protein, partial [Gemmatimonadaceae bacterium]|nr:DEAD/DEAH box helicase family protein [Gemmatimonadaceae bacterium]
MELRPYQVAAIAALRAEFRNGRKRVVLVAPCGAGKTIMFCQIVAAVVTRGKRAVVIAHRKELVDQTHEKLARFGIEAGVVMGDDVRRDSRLPVQVCSIQTLAKRLDRLPPADLVVYDEVHHAM